MKARVKATGEIVEIYRFVDTEQNEWIDCYLDFLEPIATDYWTRLEHQAAIAAMQGILTNPIGFENIRARGTNIQIETALLASEFAHTLVEKYKKEDK